MSSNGDGIRAFYREADKSRTAQLQDELETAQIQAAALAAEAQELQDLSRKADQDQQRQDKSIAELRTAGTPSTLLTRLRSKLKSSPGHDREQQALSLLVKANEQAQQEAQGRISKLTEALVQHEAEALFRADVDLAAQMTQQLQKLTALAVAHNEAAVQLHAPFSKRRIPKPITPLVLREHSLAWSRLGEHIGWLDHNRAGLRRHAISQLHAHGHQKLALQFADEIDERHGPLILREPEGEAA